MGASTNAPIILAIFAFYIFIFALLGLIGGSIQASRDFTSIPTVSPPQATYQVTQQLNGTGTVCSFLSKFNPFSSCNPLFNPSNGSVFTTITSSVGIVFDAIAFFFNGLFFSLSNIPAVINILLFAPLAITLLYIIVSLARGSS